MSCSITIATCLALLALSENTIEYIFKTKYLDEGTGNAGLSPPARLTNLLFFLKKKFWKLSWKITICFQTIESNGYMIKIST